MRDSQVRTRMPGGKEVRRILCSLDTRRMNVEDEAGERERYRWSEGGGVSRMAKD